MRATRIGQGGGSNFSFLLERDEGRFVLRRPPHGTKAKSAHDMKREYEVQRLLLPVYPYVPEMIAYCDDAAVLGCEFYVMKRIPGVIPRARMPPGLGADPAVNRRLHEPRTRRSPPSV